MTTVPQDALYLTPHETALAVAATAVKKKRLRIETLLLNSILAGLFLSVGGMLYLMAEADAPEIMIANPSMIHLIQGLVFPIGLFYVVITGVDLFNSNILFFTLGCLRGQTSVLDLLKSWTVSFIGNLGGSLVYVYLISHYAALTTSPEFIKASRDIAVAKVDVTWYNNLLRGIGCNWLVCLAIYLSFMSKPLATKFLMIVLPIFSFVATGLDHVVADMFLIPAGLVNGAPVSVGKYIYNSIIPVGLGNIIGGSLFTLLVPFYFHIKVVERDNKDQHLPVYEMEDEQPELAVDSRIVRVVSNTQATNASSPSELGPDLEKGDCRFETVEYDDRDEKINPRQDHRALGSHSSSTTAVKSL